MKPTSSSVSRRVIWPVLAILLLGNAWLIHYVLRTSEGEVEQAAIANASATVDQYKILRAYYNEEVVRKVKSHGVLKVGSDHLAPDTIPLPATMIHELSERLEKERAGVRLRLYSGYPFPHRKDRVPDAFMREAIAYFARHNDGRFTRRASTPAGDAIRVAIPDRLVAESCVNCHNTHPDSPKRDWKLGDVRGVLEVEELIEPQLAANRSMLARVAALTGLMLVIMGGGIAWIVRRHVTIPLHGVVSVLDRVVQSHGGLAGTGQSRDEIARISLSLRSMISGIRERIQAIGRNAEAVAASAQELSAVSTQVSGTAEETAAQSHGAAAAASQISQRIQTVAVSAEEMSASIGEIARNTGQASKVAAQAVAVAERTNATVAKLGDSSAEIGNVVKVISNIASQTNLLALNATIEAARAGEQGKGFAVVANEVKELARQTAQATGEISRRIAAIQHDSRSSVTAIREITAIIQEISQIQLVVAGAVDQQAVTTAEISKNTQEAARGSLGMARNISSVAEAARGSNSGAAQTAAAAAELARLAADLQRLVGEFTLDAGEAAGPPPATSIESH